METGATRFLSTPRRGPMIVRPGTVYLVGAGPGDPGLLTLRGLELLQHADVVLHDRLADERLLRHVRSEAEVVYVGKWPRSQSNTQDEITSYLIEHAREGKSVVRLKGGDPFVFGRGGEEALALADAGIPFEVVPGVTSAIAVSAYAGIPVTHRQVASSFTVVSGSEDPSKEESSIDWRTLARRHRDTGGAHGMGEPATHRGDPDGRGHGSGYPCGPHSVGDRAPSADGGWYSGEHPGVGTPGGAGTPSGDCLPGR